MNNKTTGQCLSIFWLVYIRVCIITGDIRLLYSANREKQFICTMNTIHYSVWNTATERFVR